MHAFRRSVDGYRARLQPLERQVLASVVGDVLALLAPDEDDEPDVDDAGLGDGGDDERAGTGEGPTGEGPTGEGPTGIGPDDVAPGEGNLVGRAGLDDRGWREPDAVARPSDPAVARLLPDASRDDPELAAEFRRLTQDDLRAAKVESLRLLRGRLLATVPGGELDEVVVRRGDGGRVASALTDVRLVLADRLGLHTDEDAEALHAELERRPSRRRPEPDPEHRRLAELYDALTWWQETLVTALVGDLPD